jgi:hypothetical protein
VDVTRVDVTRVDVTRVGVFYLTWVRDDCGCLEGVVE